jgi:hypothetical protein
LIDDIFYVEILSVVSLANLDEKFN